MNLIADRLFALLLGWTKTLFNGLWNMFTNDGGGFANVLQRIWLPLILLIILIGTAVDYIIWLIRWRPYYVWGAWLRKRMEHRRLSRTQNYMEDLDHSPLDLPEYQAMEGYAQPALDEPVYFDFQTPWQQEPAQMDAPMTPAAAAAPDGYADPPPQFVPVLPWESLRQVPLMHAEQQTAWAEAVNGQPDEPLDDPQAYRPDELPFMLADSGPYPQVPANAPAEAEGNGAARRRRRVDSKRQRSGRVLQSLKDTFFTSDEDAEPLDALQPPISQEEAFHKPYYPQNYTYREQPRPPAPQDKPPQ